MENICTFIDNKETEYRVLSILEEKGFIWNGNKERPLGWIPSEYPRGNYTSYLLGVYLNPSSHGYGLFIDGNYISWESSLKSGYNCVSVEDFIIKIAVADKLKEFLYDL